MVLLCSVWFWIVTSCWSQTETLIDSVFEEKERLAFSDSSSPLFVSFASLFIVSVYSGVSWTCVSYLFIHDTAKRGHAGNRFWPTYTRDTFIPSVCVQMSAACFVCLKPFPLKILGLIASSGVPLPCSLQPGISLLIWPYLLQAVRPLLITSITL